MINFENLYSLVTDRKTGAKQTNLGIDIVNIVEEIEKSRHRHSKPDTGIADAASKASQYQ